LCVTVVELWTGVGVHREYENTSDFLLKLKSDYRFFTLRFLQQ
jgi:hypothetical protein